jgi:uncharacterized protein (TIGR02246 family)
MRAENFSEEVAMRRCRRLAVGVALMIPLAACQAPVPAPAAPDMAAVKSAIEAANTKFIEAWKKGDTATMVAGYDANGIILSPNDAAWRGRDGISKGFAGMLGAMTLNDAKLNTDDVMVGGDLAVETGSYSMTLTPKKGKAMTDKGKYVTVWKHQADGSWKLLRDIWNTDAPAKM